jgi:GGDEF domain-containing protein
VWFALILLIDVVHLRVVLFKLQMIASAIGLIMIVLPALRQRNPIAWLWLLAYVPLMLVLLLTVLQYLGLAALAWLPIKAPLYALSLEMLVLLAVLHLHAKTTHSHAVRSTTLASTDPLTGFVPAQYYQDVLAKLWFKCHQANTDLSVAYVLALQDNYERTDGSSVDKKRFILRAVRMLRTVAREDDTIARVDDYVFAILMPGVGHSEVLTAKLSRLVALGMMEDKDDRRAIPIQFKVLASSLRSSNSSPEQVHATLCEAMHNPSTWKQRAIRFWPEEPHAGA